MEAAAHLPANCSPNGWPSRRFWLCACGIVVAAFATRMAAAVWWQSRLELPTSFAFADSETYWSLAGTIYRDEPFQYGSPDASVFRTPGYPALLAIVFAIAGSDNPPVIFARGLSAACGAAATAFVIALGTRWRSPTVGLITGLIAAFHPEAVSLGVFVLSEAPFHPLMVLNVWCFHEAFAVAGSSHKRRRWWSGFAAGVTAGLAALMRPSWLLFPPFLMGLKLAFIGFDLVATRLRGGRRPDADQDAPHVHDRRRTNVALAWRSVSEVARTGVPIILGVCLVMAPWWWRNYRVVGEFVPTTLQVGASLYDGWRPDAAGGSDMRFAPRFFDELKREDALRSSPLPGTFESRLDRRQREAAVAWAGANPGRVIELIGIKFARMWSPMPNSRDMGGVLLRAVIAIGFIPLMLLAAWQTWHCRREWPTAWLLWAPAVYLTCLHTIFVSSLRYRQPALLPLMALAAAAIVEAVARWLQSAWRSRHG
ncbi:MAG: glycosyltransferase family 39 protein [Planctomycetota bacterium]